MKNNQLIEMYYDPITGHILERVKLALEELKEYRRKRNRAKRYRQGRLSLKIFLKG